MDCSEISKTKFSKLKSLSCWGLKSACFLTIKRKEQQQLANTSPLIHKRRRKYNMYNIEVGKETS